MENKNAFKNRVLNYGGLIVILAAGCGSPTTTGNPNPNPGNGAQSSALTGQVADTSVQGGGNLSVTASRVNGDGTLTVVSSAAAQVGADGTYTLNLVSDVSGAGSTSSSTNANASVTGAVQLVVTAVDTANSNVVGQSAVEGTFSGTTTTMVSPINSTSTGVANLLIAAKASGQWTSNFTLGELRGLIGDQASASLMGSATGNTSAAATAAAQVAIAAMASWQGMLTAQGITQTDITNALNEVGTAEAMLDTQLNAAATSSTAQSAAASANFTSFVQAFTDSGATSLQLALAATASAQTMAAFASTLSASAQGQVMSRAAIVESTLLGSAISGEFQAMGASTTQVQAVGNAAATLQTQITAAASAGAQAGAQIQAALAQYETAVSGQLIGNGAGAVGLNLLNGNVLATLTASLKTDLQALVSAQSSLSSSANASAAATAEAKALSQFMTSGLANQSVLTTAGVSQAQASAFLDVVLQLEAATGASIASTNG